MQLYVGTSGYSYKEWKGVFYPDELPNKEMLQYYSVHLPAVEINNTFYRMPTAGMLAAWTEQVPVDFRFVLKASRKITHTKPLKDKADEVAYLFQTIATLSDRLGAVLFQLPPYLRKDSALLAGFADLLPPGTKAAFEFRHASWFDDDVYDILHTRGFALCCSDGENADLQRLVATADWGYLRLRRPDYAEPDLLEWTRRIQSQSWQKAFVFFKHEQAGTGPILAGQLLDLAKRQQS